MKESFLIDEFKSSLGYPVVDVYMTDKMIEDQIKVALQKFRANVFKKDVITVPAAKCVELDKNDVAMVIQVDPVLPEQSNFIYARNEFALTEAMMYFNSRDNFIQTPILARMVRNQMRRVFDDKFDYAYDRESGKLLLDNVPQDITEVSLTVKRYYKLEDIPQYAEDWFFDYAFAKVKQVEGRIRNKFKDSIPGAPTDGDQLISEGKSDEATLETTLQDLVSYDVGVRY